MPVPDPAPPGDERAPRGDDRAPTPRPGVGLLIAVWGPPGAPGRTTVAVGLADALARMGRSVCLVDADTYAPSIGLALGVSGTGLADACRAFDGTAVPTLDSAVHRLRPSIDVLTGLGSPGQWCELRPVALEAVWSAARGLADATVVDVGSCLEDDDAGSPWARRRNAAAVTALAQADRVVAVAHGSASGVARLASAWDGLPGPGLREVVQNRAGRGSRDWEQAAHALGIDARVHRIPQDERVVRASWERGATLSEHAPRARITRAMRSLAEALVGD